MDIDSQDKVAMDEKPLMASTSKLIFKLKARDNSGAAGDNRGCFIRETYSLVVCSLCGKTFRSRNTLYGHMRCHPDRHYRGMHPTKAFKITTRSEPLSVVDDHHQIDYVDLLRCLPAGWAVKAKRSCIRAPFDEDLWVHGAAYGLMLMATGNHRYRYLDDDDDDEIEDEDELQMSSLSILGSACDEQQKCTDSDNMKTERERRKTGKDKDSEQSDADAVTKGYKCSICDKTFANFQALGGHTSSAHSKPQQFERQPPPPPPATATRVTRSEVGRHICKICDKALPSGQALGGHMSLHRAGPSLPLSSSTLMTSLPGQVQPAPMSSENGGSSNTATAETSRPVVDFDLNQLPLPDDDTGAQNPNE